MNVYSKTVAALAAATVLAFGAIPAQAEPGAGDAAKVRTLEMMLMVGALRCRFGGDDFQADYARFRSAQSAALDGAYRELKADYARRHGAKGAELALDRFSVGVANTYGQGHPWLGCGQLKAVTQDLVSANDRAKLVAAADYTLSPGPALALAVAH